MCTLCTTVHFYTCFAWKNYKYDWILNHRGWSNTSWVILHNMLRNDMFSCSIWERRVEVPASLMAGFWFLRYKVSLLHWMLSFSLLFLRKSRMLLKSAPSVLFTYNNGRKRHKDNMFDRCAYQTRKRSTSEELWCCFLRRLFLSKPLHRATEVDVIVWNNEGSKTLY